MQRKDAKTPIKIAPTVKKDAIQEWEQWKSLYIKNFNAFKTVLKGIWGYEIVANRPYYFANPTEEPTIQYYEKREHF